MKKNAQKHRRALAIAANTFIYVFCVLCLALLTFTVFSKRNADGAVDLLGYEMRIVLSGSMEKHPDVNVSEYKIKDIRTGSMVFVQLVPDDETKAEEFYSKMKVGDVLTFRYVVAQRQETITHRIVDVQPKDIGGYIITLRGDNVSNGATGEQVIDTADVNSPNYVIGKVTGKSFLFGRFVYSLKTPLGLALLIIIPCSIIIVWHVIKIINSVKIYKRKSTQ